MKFRSLFLLLLWTTGVFASTTARSEDLHLYAVLDNGPLVPDADSTASGEAKAVLHDDGSLEINAVFAGLASEVTEVSLHTGAANATGPAVAPLTARTTAAGVSVNQRLTLQPGPAADVRAGNAYLLVVTADRPFGALRGQLVPQPVHLPPQTP
jgi:CHRD domain-containing protein